MKDTALYEHLLGLKTPWSVKSVDLSLADQRVVVEVILKRGQVWADPTDSTKRAHINGWTERQWRHLDTCQFETLIKARVPQLKYSDGTVEKLAVPWAERYSRVTILMEAFVVKLLQACPTTQGVCELTRLAWSTVNGIVVSAVERGMLRRSKDDVPNLGLDEKSSERGHSYVSILTDIDRSRVLDLVPERKLAAAKSLLETLGPTQRASVKAVAMDMWPAFINTAQTCRCHETGLLNYSEHRINNACAEEFNSAIQLIKANAQGFRNFINYRARILFHCGKLNMSLG